MRPVAARYRGRDDRIGRYFAATQNVRFWHKADMPNPPLHVRFRG